ALRIPRKLTLLEEPQLSSKGKVYFYNCITEISQWQKPSEWTLPDVSKKELLKMIGDRYSSRGLLRTPLSREQVRNARVILLGAGSKFVCVERIMVFRHGLVRFPRRRDPLGRKRKK
ncbi:unnamed protein product, partial [Schistocephalus solidus]|uniref:WW domain-containing protein n=1 Tax=Schistocephalus solidus TaxID=70667 RepID=A0A183TIP9_SCHSO